MSQLINVNGRITPAAEAVIPVLDHGFLYGDAVYETLRTYGGAPCLADRHLRRLAASCSRIRIEAPDPGRIRDEIARTLGEAVNAESYIRVMVTRGAGAIGYEHTSELKPCVVIIVLELQPIPAERYTGAESPQFSGGGAATPSTPSIRPSSPAISSTTSSRTWRHRMLGPTRRSSSTRAATSRRDPTPTSSSSARGS